MMPNFRNVHRQDTDFLRGYMVHFGAGRGRATAEGLGAAFKDAICEAGNWGVYMMMQGETIPKESNQVRLSKQEKDPWGIPQLITSVAYDDNDEKIVKDFLEQGRFMLEKAGCKNISSNDSKQSPGLDIHEMGGVRMGKDPRTSLLNAFNQLHHCENVFVTDGACMVSTGTQNPSLTYMALTARAAHHAVAELKKDNL
jgi:choline dehydrogenase-like flavoprotein